MCLPKTRWIHRFGLLLSCFISFPSIANHKVCAIYPHLKDSYWLSVNYGMVQQARQLNVDLRVLESGGYPNLDKQKRQLSVCANWGANAIILGTVDPNAYASGFHTLSGNIPIFATVNALTLSDLNREAIKGTVGVDWHDMGYLAGQYLAQRHPNSVKEVSIALLPGPKSSGGTKPVLEGFFNAIEGSSIKVVGVYWADNDKELQRNLIQNVIESEKVDYIVGSAVAIEVAISELRSANLSEKIGLVSTYLSHGVYRGLVRAKVKFAPSDQMVMQGELSMIQAVSYLTDRPYNKVETPKIISLTPESVYEASIQDSLSPSEFRPTFLINSD